MSIPKVMNNYQMYLEVFSSEEGKISSQTNNYFHKRPVFLPISTSITLKKERKEEEESVDLDVLNKLSLNDMINYNTAYMPGLS